MLLHNHIKLLDKRTGDQNPKHLVQIFKIWTNCCFIYYFFGKCPDISTWLAAFPFIQTDMAQYAPRLISQDEASQVAWYSLSFSDTRERLSDHLIRMHLTGEPSAPTCLRGKQWRLYTPTGTSSSFRPSTGIMSWQNKESKSTNGSHAMHILDTRKGYLK